MPEGYTPPLTADERMLAVAALRDVLARHFAPAKDAGDADEMYTTLELHQVIDEHSPGTVRSPQHLRELLLALHYREQRIGTEVRWMLKRANAPFSG